MESRKPNKGPRSGGRDITVDYHTQVLRVRHGCFGVPDWDDELEPIERCSNCPDDNKECDILIGCIELRINVQLLPCVNPDITIEGISEDLVTRIFDEATAESQNGVPSIQTVMRIAGRYARGMELPRQDELFDILADRCAVWKRRDKQKEESNQSMASRSALMDGPATQQAPPPVSSADAFRSAL